MQLLIQLKNLENHRYITLRFIQWLQVLVYLLFWRLPSCSLIFIELFTLWQRDLPIGILGSLLICVGLYIAVCLVITGMVPYKFLGEDAPLAEAFTSRGLKYVSILISIGAVAGLTTTLLVGLYVQVMHFRFPVTNNWHAHVTKSMGMYSLLGFFLFAVSVIFGAWKGWFTTFDVCKSTSYKAHPCSFSGLGWYHC